jgi:beta-fructofuranosidase
MNWYPRDKYSWDFWFAWDKENKLHVFYLQASQLECAYNPERRHDRSSVGHAVLNDYGWQEVNPDQPALEARRGNKGDKFWDDLSIWTGSIIQEKGTYYMFYTARMREDCIITTPHERLRPQQIGVAISGDSTTGDLTTWDRLSKNNSKPEEIGLVIPNPGNSSGFDGANWRDPYVIKDHKRLYAFICARPRNAAPDADGMIAIAWTENLDLAQAKWEIEKEDLYKSEEFYQIEVPQVFWRKFGDYWRLYLLFSPQEKDASSQRRDPRTGTYYLCSQEIKDRKKIQYTNIPWEHRKPAQLLADGLYGGKIVSDLKGFAPTKTDQITEEKSEGLEPDAQIIGEKPVFFGFQFEDQAGKFVGGLSDPRWVKFNDDGRIELYLDKELKTLDPDLQ